MPESARRPSTDAITPAGFPVSQVALRGTLDISGPNYQPTTADDRMIDQSVLDHKIGKTGKLCIPVAYPASLSPIAIGNVREMR
jgi:hypothetical protein